MSAPPGRQGWVLASIDHLLLLIPQREVESLEPVMDIADLQHADGDVQGSMVGWLDVDGRTLAVFAPDDELRPQSVLPARRRACIVLNADDERYCVVADSCRLVGENELQRIDLPVCMMAPGLLSKEIALVDEQVACVVDAAMLAGCLHDASVVTTEVTPS